MQLTKEKRGECSILLVHGRLDGTTSPKFETEVLGWLSTGGKSFVLDMAGISFMSSAALRVLLTMAKRVGRLGGKVVLSSPNAVVSEVFEISNFSAMFTICPTLDEGVTAATQGVAASAPAAAAPVPPPPVASPAPAPVVPPPVVAKPEPPPAPPTPPPVAPRAAEPPPVAPAPVTPPTPPPAPVKAEEPPAPPTVPMSVTPAPTVPVPAAPAPKPVATAAPPPITPAPAPAPVTPPPAAAVPPPAPVTPTAPAPVSPPPAAKKAGLHKLELVVGTYVVECRDGDVIGSEGTVATHLFKSAPSLQPRHILIGKSTDSWFVMVPRNVQVVTHLDNVVLAPGVRKDLGNEHQLSIGDFAFSLRLSESPGTSVNESFFKRLFKMLNLG